MAGRDGDPGPVGPAGVPGVKGDPGFGLAGAFIDQTGQLCLTLSNGELRSVGLVVGADGFDLSDFSATYDGERGVTLKFESGKMKREFTFHLPVVIHRGFWQAGRKAKAGDAWTADGSLWIAKYDTDLKPCYANRNAWTMAARRGRDANTPAREDDAPAAPVKLS
jgi:hypothetical protein